jgi:hypothetical protein
LFATPSEKTLVKYCFSKAYPIKISEEKSKPNREKEEITTFDFPEFHENQKADKHIQGRADEDKGQNGPHHWNSPRCVRHASGIFKNPEPGCGFFDGLFYCLFAHLHLLGRIEADLDATPGQNAPLFPNRPKDYLPDHQRLDIRNAGNGSH